MEQRRSRETDCAFDFKTARETAESFSAACGVSCAVLDGEGGALFAARVGCEGCEACRALNARRGIPSPCDKLHLYGVAQAERQGGRYTYFCPSGLAYFASPIKVGGRTAGALVGGPALIMDVEDYLASDPELWRGRSPEEMAELCGALECSPAMEPTRLSHMAALLSAAAVCVGESGKQEECAHIQPLKAAEAPERYPMDKERELVRVVKEGDQTTARQLLRELVEHIRFASGGDFGLMRSRALELMAVLSRAAVDGGGDQDTILDMNSRCLSEIDHLRTAEELALWLTRMTDRFADTVFSLVEVKHRDIICKAIEYLKRNCRDRVTLEDTAGHVGLSPSYFSRVFKEEVGESFNSYLTALRISRGRAMLLDTDASIAEICDRCGFDDQSYFTKVFRKYTGVTPGRFRARRGRPETGEEPGRKQA